MRKLWSKTGAFMTGTLATVLIVVVLMTTGVLPVKTERTVVVATGAAAAGASASGTSSASTADVAARTDALTPAEIYERSAAGVVEVLASFSATGGTTPYGPASGTAQALGSGFVVSK